MKIYEKQLESCNVRLTMEVMRMLLKMLIPSNRLLMQEQYLQEPSASARRNQKDGIPTSQQTTQRLDTLARDIKKPIRVVVVDDCHIRDRSKLLKSTHLYTYIDVQITVMTSAPIRAIKAKNRSLMMTHKSAGYWLG